MRTRKNICTENFNHALTVRDEPDKFIEVVARMLGSSGEKLRSWAKALNNESELGAKIDEILDEGKCCDEWVFLFSTCGGEDIPKGSSKSSTSRATIIDNDSSVCDTDPDHIIPRKSRASLIGKKIHELLDTLISTISSTILSGGSKFVVIYGGSVSGKTTFVRALAQRLLDEREIISTNYRDLATTSAPGFDARRVVILDDADIDLASPNLINEMIKYYRSTSHVLVFTCRDLGKLTTMIDICNGEIHRLPHPTDVEMVSILSKMVINGYCVSASSAKNIMNLLNAFRVQEKMRKAIDSIRLLLYPRLYSDYRKSIVRMSKTEVDAPDSTVEKVVSQVIGVKIRTATKATEKKLDIEIKKTFKGQEHVVKDVLPTLVSVSSGLTDPSKPAGVLLFFGPTGSGKSHLAKVIADVLFEGAYHKEDMNTYSEKHSVSRLTGAPPGYIGYDDVPAMMNFIDSHSRGVLLLDEIEKSHDSVIDHIMEFLDTGIIVDTKGRAHDARGFLIVMTSNAMFNGNKKGFIGFEDTGGKESRDARDDLRETRKFRDEFLGRIQIVSKFKQLEQKDIKLIAKLMLDELEVRLLSVGVSVTDKESILKEIVGAYTKSSGARSMRNYMETHVKNKALEKGRS